MHIEQVHETSFPTINELECNPPRPPHTLNIAIWFRMNLSIPHPHHAMNCNIVNIFCYQSVQLTTFLTQNKHFDCFSPGKYENFSLFMEHEVTKNAIKNWLIAKRWKAIKCLMKIRIANRVVPTSPTPLNQHQHKIHLPSNWWRTKLTQKSVFSFLFLHGEFLECIEFKERKLTFHLSTLFWRNFLIAWQWTLVMKIF